jgi:hypothetical protein
LIDNDTDLRLEATRVLSDTGLRLEATGISTSAYISKKIAMKRNYPPSPLKFNFKGGLFYKAF